MPFPLSFRIKICLFLLFNIVITELHAEEEAPKKADDSDWTGYSKCDPAFCLKACSTNKATEGISDSSQQFCKCDRDKFSHAALQKEGDLRITNMSIAEDNVCARTCEKQSSYGRIWLKDSNGTSTKHCLCLTGQVTSHGFTLCDRHNRGKSCYEVCLNNPDSHCAFNGVCICRATWSGYFNLTAKNARVERAEEKGECDANCKDYNYDWVGRVYDTESEKTGAVAKFGQKYCLCGEEVLARNLTLANKLRDEGFQMCTGIKCKQRCQSLSAYCEPENRRACYCNSQNIFIKKHLWSRLPSHEETMCQQACNLAGLDSRVIEWNPFFVPSDQRLEPFYRKTPYQYLYDGKFCHCIRTEVQINQFRPCTDELCVFFCGHQEAMCDPKTRRACFCNTHKLMLTVGRLPEPPERPCDITCRANKMTGRLLDVTWKNTVAHWGGRSVNKYCACIRPVTNAGISHCEPENDQCPKMCQHPESYCTKEKVCQCGEGNLSVKKNVRKGTVKEWDECAEKCRSWMWPISADLDNKAWIYDSALENENATLPQSAIAGTDANGTNGTMKDFAEEDPASFTFQESPGQVGLAIEALYSWSAPKKFCLCAKTTSTFHNPGFRGLAYIEPVRVPTNKVPCINNHTCIIFKSGLEILY